MPTECQLSESIQVVFTRNVPHWSRHSLGAVPNTSSGHNMFEGEYILSKFSVVENRKSTGEQTTASK